MKRIAAILTLLTACIVPAMEAAAQDETYRFDIGGGIGMSGYLATPTKATCLSIRALPPRHRSGI